MTRIKELRLENKWTQTELAEQLGVNQTAVGKYERGDLEPNLQLLLRLSKLFHCSIDYILGNSDDFGTIHLYPTLDEGLSLDERRLLQTFRALNASNKARVSAYAEVRLEEQI